MKVVSNTSPILCLHKIGKLGLLENLFGQVYIPQEVPLGKRKHESSTYLTRCIKIRIINDNEIVKGDCMKYSELKSCCGETSVSSNLKAQGMKTGTALFQIAFSK